MERKNDQVQGKKIQCTSSTTDTRQETKTADKSFEETCNAMLEEHALLEKIPHCLRKNDAMYDKSLYQNYGMYMYLLCVCMCDIVCTSTKDLQDELEKYEVHQKSV